MLGHVRQRQQLALIVEHVAHVRAREVEQLAQHHVGVDTQAFRLLGPQVGNEGLNLNIC
jgi:hypothetical protein